MRNLLLCGACFCLYVSQREAEGAPIRGTWVTNVASDALHSKETVQAAVARCKAYGLNTIYVVVWNKAMTMYPSDVAERYIGIRQDPFYQDFDPIKEIIDQGHKEGLKIYAWFEYGFAYSYGDLIHSSPWLQKYPHWAGRDASGELLKKDKFYWWNALHHEVQEFMSELVLEVVKKYDVDGIQGDDRLPAMPSEGGYDAYTKALYAKEHAGSEPPLDSKNPAWVKWRCDRLSRYAEHLYRAVKRERPSCIVSWAPSVYPGSKEQYLQDWPAWLKGGYADEVLPQLYRHDVVAYEKLLKELENQVSAEAKARVFPGMEICIGNYLTKPDTLEQMIRLNRKHGFSGECAFYYEGLKKLPRYYP